METRIKQLRKEAGLTQKELALKIDVSQSNIARWENEEQEPSASSLIALSKFFIVTVGYLLGIED